MSPLRAAVRIFRLVAWVDAGKCSRRWPPSATNSHDEPAGAPMTAVASGCEVPCFGPANCANSPALRTRL